MFSIMTSRRVMKQGAREGFPHVKIGLMFNVTKTSQGLSVLLCDATNALGQWISLSFFFLILYPIKMLNFCTGSH